MRSGENLGFAGPPPRADRGTSRARLFRARDAATGAHRLARVPLALANRAARALSPRRSGALSGLGNAVAGATLAEYSDGEEEARAPRLEDPARHPAFTVFDVGRSGVNRVHPEADEASRGAMSAKIRFRLLEGVDIGAFDKTTSRRDDDRRESSRSPRAPRPAPRRARDARPDGRGARVRASGRTRGSRARARRRAPVPSVEPPPPHRGPDPSLERQLGGPRRDSLRLARDDEKRRSDPRRGGINHHARVARFLFPVRLLLRLLGALPASSDPSPHFPNPTPPQARSNSPWGRRSSR